MLSVWQSDCVKSVSNLTLETSELNDPAGPQRSSSMQGGC